MFSDTIKQFSGYFDRRSLVAAFFPSLVSWYVIALVFFGWERVSAAFEHAPAPRVVLLLVSFLAVVSVWSVIVRSLQPLLVQMYQGNLQVWFLSSIIYPHRRRHWERRLENLRAHTDKLSKLKPVLDQLRQDLEALNLPTKTDNLGAREQVGIDSLLKSLETYADSGLVSRLRTFIRRTRRPFGVDPDRTAEQLQRATDLVSDMQVWQGNVVPLRRRKFDDPWGRWRPRLHQCCDRIGLMVSQVAEDRVRSERELRRYYPSFTAPAMPTKLGNVLTAVEAYALANYNIDATILWPRLQAALPKDSSDSLQDAKDAMDSMVTLSAHTALLNVVLSAWLTWGVLAHANPSHLPHVLVVGVYLSLFFAVPIVLIAISMRQLGFVRALGAGFAALYGVGGAVLFAIFVAGAAHKNHSSPLYIAANSILYALLCVGFASIFLACIAWPLYEVAVQNALVYADKARTSFDMYRWAVLESLHLQVPANLSEERQMWGQICIFLASGVEPDPNYYSYTVTEATKALVDITPSGLPVPSVELAAMQPISADSITQEQSSIAADPQKGSDDFVQIKDELVGLYPLRSLPPGKPIRRCEVVGDSLVEHTVTVGIGATAAMTLGGTLQTGDFVDIGFVRPTRVDGPSPQPKLFERVLLLNLIPGEAREGDDAKAATALYTLVVVLPESEHLAFEVARASGTMFIHRRSILPAHA